MNRGNRSILVLLAFCLILLAVFKAYYPENYLQSNFAEAVNFVSSAQFLYFVLAGAVLVDKRLTDSMYKVLVFVFSLLCLTLFYRAHLDIFSMAGDNICQLAYWKILFHPNLTGSIGATYTKPGQIVLSGILYELTAIAGASVFRIGLCLVMAACVWILVVIATDVGGRVAGIIALPMSIWAFLFEFLAGSSTMYLIPALYSGLWLYFYDTKRKGLGRALLVLSLQFHIQTIAVLGVIWLLLVWRRDWKELKVFTVFAVSSIVVWALVIFRVQGALDRFNGGSHAGYVWAHGGHSLLSTKFGYLLQVIGAALGERPPLPLLLVVTAVGIAGAWYLGYKKYLSVFFVLLVFLTSVVVLDGEFNIERFFALIYAFGCSVGLGSMVYFIKGYRGRLSWRTGMLAGAPVLLLVAMVDYSVFNARTRLQPGLVRGYVADAATLLSDTRLPHPIRLMTEDDLLYPIVAWVPDRYPSLASLQHFSHASDDERRNILSKTDYLWIALNSRHGYYYLNYIPVSAWNDDVFRSMVIGILWSNQAGVSYGYTFVPIDSNSERLILKVEPGGMM